VLTDANGKSLEDSVLSTLVSTLVRLPAGWCATEKVAALAILIDRSHTQSSTTSTATAFQKNAFQLSGFQIAVLPVGEGDRVVVQTSRTRLVPLSQKRIDE
jgi:hypothetical protein